MRLEKFRVRPSRFMVTLTAAALVAALPALGVVLATFSLPSMVILASLATFVAWSLSRSRWRNNGELELVKKGAIVRSPGFVRTMKRARIEDGYDVPPNGIVLRMRDGVELEGTLAGDPKEVLRHLDLTLDQRALSAPLRGTLGSFTRGLLGFLGSWTFASCVATALVQHVSAQAVLATFVFSILVAFFLVRWLKPHVIVGVDGVRVAGVLRPFFIPYSEIEKVKRGYGIVLEGKFGARMLPVIGQSNEQVDALVRRIEEGRRRRASSTARPLDLLERGERTVADWMREVRSAMSGGFRDLAFGKEDLERVLSDPDAPLERRVGAALALREDEEGRTRIRVAADTSADPRVRVALQAASADDLDEEEVLRSLEKKR